MPIATLYDVHGNIRALEAVLAEIPADAAIVVGGDVEEFFQLQARLPRPGFSAE